MKPCVLILWGSKSKAKRAIRLAHEERGKTTPPQKLSFSIHNKPGNKNKALRLCQKPNVKDKEIEIKLNTCYATSPESEQDFHSLSGAIVLHDRSSDWLSHISDMQWMKSDNVLHLEGTWSVFCVLHVLWMVLQAADKLSDWMVLVADLIHCTEQWEPGGRSSSS